MYVNFQQAGPSMGAAFHRTGPGGCQHEGTMTTAMTGEEGGHSDVLRDLFEVSLHGGEAGQSPPTVSLYGGEEGQQILSLY